MTVGESLRRFHYLLGLTDDSRPVDEILALQKKSEPPPSDEQVTASQFSELAAKVAALESALAAKS